MDIKKVISLQSARQITKKNRIVEVTFIFDQPLILCQTPQEVTELNQKYEHDARVLLDFISTLPIGTVGRLRRLLQEELGYL